MSSVSQKLNAIQPGALILITGANGYIGSQVADVLLSLGYRVRGTVRSEKPWLVELFQSKYGTGKFETVVLPSLEDENKLAEAMKGVSGVAHVASDVSFSPDPNMVIPVVIAATKSVLKAAAKASVTRVVLTSSSSAAVNPKPGVKGIVITEDSWNEKAVKAAWDENTPTRLKGGSIYAASKTEGERTALNWVKENKPDFVLNTILPNYTLGTILHSEIAGSTMKFAADLLKGDDTASSLFSPQWYVNVKDVARLHAIALLDPNVKNERIFAFASTFTWTEIITILRKLRPSSETLVDPPANELEDLSDIVPSKRALQLLQSTFGQADWIGLEQSLKEGVDSIGY